MKYLALLTLALMAPCAYAEVNLAATCTNEAVIGTSRCGAATVFTRVNDQSIVKANGIWTRFGVATGTLTACPADIEPPQPTCPVGLVDLVKSAVVAEPPATMKWRLTWKAPTHGIQEGKTVALKAGDVLAYQVTWHPDGGGRGGEVELSAALTTYILEIPASRAWISLSVKGNGVWSESSPQLLADPNAAKVVTPNAATEFTIEHVQ